MSLSLFIAPRLNERTKQGILRGEFSEEELDRIYQTTIPDKKEAGEALIIDAILLLVFFGFMIYQMTSGFTDMVAEALTIMGVCFVICMLMLYYSLFHIRKRQFRKLIKKAYPQLLEKYQ